MAIAPGRSALITGGASGFGLEIARRLITAEASVAGLDVSGESLEAASSELGPRYLPIQADVRDSGAGSRAVATSVERFGSLDTLIVSAGVIHIKPLAEVTETDWDITLDVNLKGAFLAMQAAAPQISTAGTRGRIVAISSDAGKLASLGSRPIGHPSSAWWPGRVGGRRTRRQRCDRQRGLPSRRSRDGHGPRGPRLEGACDRSKDVDEINAAAAASNPLGSNASVADVVAAVEFFLTDEAAFLTGNALDVDGGARLGFLPGT